MKKTIQKIKIALLAMVCAFTMLGITMEVKAGPADNSLKYIEVSTGSLSPAFESSRLNYTVHVGADTTSIDVSAKTSNSNAKILSGVGTYTLSENETKAKILVEAENGTQVTYTVTIVKDGAGQPADTDEPADEPANTPDDTTDEPDDTASQPDTGVEGYTITDLPETMEAPSGFTETTAKYNDKEYTAYKFDNGDIILFYMTNEAEEGGLFVYNLQLGHLYPFIRVDAGEHKLILMEASAYESIYPGDSATLTIDGQVFEGAFQRESGDEYQFYAMDENGVEGWYQYNVATDTFSTFSMSYEVEEPEDDDSDSDYLQKSYNDLNDKFNARKERDIKIIAGLIVVIVLLLFVIINLLLRGGRVSEEDDDDEDDIFEEDASGKKSGRRFSRKIEDDDFWGAPEDVSEDTIDLTGIAEMADTDTVADTESEADVEETAEAATDSEDADDFEEDFSDYKREKKEKKKEKRRKNHDIFDDDDDDDLFGGQKMFVDKMDSDDDIEVMDLNDL